MEQTPQSQGAGDWTNSEAAAIAFKEYQFLAEGTDKITDRRQTVNTLFVSINALFLTGVGYLLLQFLQNVANSALFIVGFLAIAIITGSINRAWLKLSESNRRLVDLRIRYLKQLEKHLRRSAIFPALDVPLKKDEVRAEGVNVETTRGTYTLEDVLYNPGSKKEPFGFSRAEQQIGRTFRLAYWLAFAFSVVAYFFTVVVPALGLMSLPYR